MTDEETRAFLAAASKLQVATIGKDGAPHLTTLFSVLLDDGRLAFWTYAASQKVRNLERDPRISCLAETGTGYAELRGVSIQGTAEVVRNPDRIREIGTAVVGMMAGGADLGEWGREVVERQVAKRVGVIITPAKVATWDHRKLAATPGG
jgi:PPOX class probable F420-dependent enzyme